MNYSRFKRYHCGKTLLAIDLLNKITTFLKIRNKY